MDPTSKEHNQFLFGTWTAFGTNIIKLAKTFNELAEIPESVTVFGAEVSLGIHDRELLASCMNHAIADARANISEEKGGKGPVSNVDVYNHLASFTNRTSFISVIYKQWRNASSKIKEACMLDGKL